MLKIRLQRVGRINSPAYRIVVTEHARAATKGLIEKLGTYNPKTKERAVNEERVKYWLSVGAKPSDTMHNMLVSLGIIAGKKINVLPKFKAPAEAAVEAKEEAAEKAVEQEAKAEAKEAHDAEVKAEVAGKEAEAEAAPAEQA